MLILLTTKPAFLCFVIIGLVTTFKTLNKDSINTVDRPLSSTVIWHDSIDYGFIILEPKSGQLLQHYQFWLYPLKDSYSKICTSPPRCRTKKNGNSDFFDINQDVFADIQTLLFPNFWIPKYHCLEKVYRHSEFRLDITCDTYLVQQF